MINTRHDEMSAVQNCRSLNILISGVSKKDEAGDPYVAPRIKTVKLFADAAMLQGSYSESLIGISWYSIDDDDSYNDF